MLHISYLVPFLEKCSRLVTDAHDLHIIEVLLLGELGPDLLANRSVYSTGQTSVAGHGDVQLLGGLLLLWNNLQSNDAIYYLSKLFRVLFLKSPLIQNLYSHIC